MKCAPLAIGLLCVIGSCRAAPARRAPVMSLGGHRLASPLPGERVVATIIATNGDRINIALTTAADGSIHRTRTEPLAAEPAWSLDTSKLPRGIAASAVEADLVGPDAARYLGRTNRAANAGAEILCGERDGASVTSFDALPTAILAVQCQWRRGSQVLEVDRRIARDARLHSGPHRPGRAHSIAAIADALAAAGSKLARGRGTNESWR